MGERLRLQEEPVQVRGDADDGTDATAANQPGLGLPPRELRGWDAAEWLKVLNLHEHVALAVLQPARICSTSVALSALY